MHTHLWMDMYKQNFPDNYTLHKSISLACIANLKYKIILIFLPMPSL